MGGRAKILGVFSLLGFMAGVIAYITYQRVLPILITIFPELLHAEWFLSGVAGAFMSLIIVVVWATVSPPT